MPELEQSVRRICSIVLSVFNEEEVLETFWDQLKVALVKVSDFDFELLWVNDGSTDRSQERLSSFKAVKDSNSISHKVLEFSKNFGHEAAMIAGIDHAAGDVVICMDADGQNPPAEIERMLGAFSDGAEIVLMERMKQASSRSYFKRSFSSIFYRLINQLSSIKMRNNSSDFFLISRRVADIFRNAYREKVRFIRGFIQSIGFETTTLTFRPDKRLAGKSKYNFKGLSSLAFNAIFSLSNRPLRLSILFSLGFVLFTIVLIVYSLIKFFYGESPPSGYTTIIIFLSLSFSFLFITLTVISLYFEKIVEEMRQRPLYIIKSIQKDDKDN